VGSQHLGRLGLGGLTQRRGYVLRHDLIAREAAGEPAGAAVVAPGLMVLAIILFMARCPVRT
jgi:hypothetical protein